MWSTSLQISSISLHLVTIKHFQPWCVAWIFGLYDCCVIFSSSANSGQGGTVCDIIKGTDNHLRLEGRLGQRQQGKWQRCRNELLLCSQLMDLIQRFLAVFEKSALGWLQSFITFCHLGQFDLLVGLMWTMRLIHLQQNHWGFNIYICMLPIETIFYWELSDN